MDRAKVRRNAAIGAACAVVGLAVALAAPSIGEAPPDTVAPGSCVDFAREVDPKEVAVDSGYDPDAGLVHAHDGRRRYVLELADPACRTLSASRIVIDDAVRTHAANEAVACAEVSRDLEAGGTKARGRAFDRAAAERYLAERCGGPR